jgi:tetratricopeptide (TPR) repeat protein
LVPLLAFLGLTALSYWDKRRRLDDRLLAQATVKRIKEVRPGLRSANADVAIADFRPDVFIARKADREAAQVLDACGGLVLIGRPLSGKTRAALEVMRRSPEAVVVIPREDRPPDFSRDGLRGKDVILFIDDLHLVAPTLDLMGWLNRLRIAGTRTVRLVCTSRDGADWARVEEHQRLLIQQFGPACRVHTSRGPTEGADVTLEEGKALAARLDLKLSDEEFVRRFDGTPGSLTLDLSAMGARYRLLNQERVNGALGSRLIDSVKLLDRGGQPRLREDTVRAVAETIRGNQPLSNETWDALRRRTEEEGFGVFVGGEFRTYRPYLESPECVGYEPGEDEIEALLPLLQARRDFEGLFYLGAEWQETNADLAKRAYQAAADGGIGRAANNLGTILMEEGDLDEAEAALNRAIELGADLAYGNLGKLLSDHTDRTQEAEGAFRAGAARGIANARFGLGHHLAKQKGREADAEAAYREAIERGDNGALLNLGNLLKDVPGRRADAEQLVRDAIAAGIVEAFNSLGAILMEGGKRGEAEATFKAGIDKGCTWCSLGLADLLAEVPETWDDAERRYRDAATAGVLESHLRLGVLLSKQPGRAVATAEALEKAAELGEIDGDGYHRLGAALMEIPGRVEAAEAALRSAIRDGDRLAINSLGILFASMEGKEAEAEVLLTSATVVAPEVAHRNLGVLLARQEGRERDAEQAFRAAIAAGDVRAYLDLGRLLLPIPGRTADACFALRRAAGVGIGEAIALLHRFCEGVQP